MDGKLSCTVTMEAVTQTQPEEEKIAVPPYRSTESHNKSFQVMNSLREQNQLCDVLLKAAGNEIPAHRVVLASSSPYFLAMFTGELSESRQTVVTMREIDSHALELLVQYIYTAEIEVTEDNVQVRLKTISVFIIIIVIIIIIVVIFISGTIIILVKSN